MTSTAVTEAAPSVQPAPPATSTPAPEPTAAPAGVLPIVDMHFHPDGSWDLDALVALMDELGVQRAAGGSGDPTAIALDFAAAYPERFVPFAGQDGIRALNLLEGAESWNLETAAIQTYVARLETELQSGCWAGIGEVFVNTLGSHVSGGFSVPADSVLMRRLLDLSAQYAAPLSVHMDAASASVAELRRLLDSNPDGTLIWAHAGWYAEPQLLREMLQAHLNLYVELSFRDELRSFFAVTSRGQLRDDWRALLEEMPQRFVLGTDLNPPPTSEKYRELIVFWRSVLEQLTPATAAMLANENATRIVGGSMVADAEACASMVGG